MHLLSLKLQSPGAISQAVYGNFSAPKAQEICVARNNAIELLRPDDTGKIVSICFTPVFCVVRSLTPFRLSGANRDYLVIGSDSGKISIVEFDVQLGDWKVIHCEVYGKTGCRRIVPGQYIAADPKGRALMVASIEKQKFVYVMSRDAGNRLTISSPLEAHKSEVLLFSVVGLDVGFENPVFAMIELEYSEADHDHTGAKLAETDKKLTYYELDLGLNHVVRKWSEPISRTANILLAVPGGDDGPSGVLVCGENWVSYKHQGHAEIRAPLPRRFDLPSSRGLLITTGVLHRQKSGFFFLIQSEYGDLYKVTLESTNVANPKAVTNIIVVVFDTIQPANSFCITRVGLLYVASEFGNHSLYQFQGLGDDPAAVRSEALFNDELGDDAESASKVAPLFRANEKLQNLLLVDDSPSIAPVTDMLVENVTATNELDSTQIYTLCGSGIRSSLRLLRHGLPVTEMATSELPGRPTGVWMVRERVDEGGDGGPTYDKYIVVGFSNSTIVLSVGDTVEEVYDSGLLGTSGTLQVCLMTDNSLIQIHLNGIRHIRGSAERGDRRTNEWKTPGGRAIERAAVNSRQVIVALARVSGETLGEVIYFELDAAGQLTETGSVTLGVGIVSMDMGLVPTGRARSNFLAVGCDDNTVQVLSLDPSDMLSQRALISVSARPEAVCLAMLSRESGGSGASIGVSQSAKSALQQAQAQAATLTTAPMLYLHVGLVTGVLVRVAVDTVSGSLSDSRQRFLGPKPVKLFRVVVQGQPAVIALSSRPWLLYNYQGRHLQSPMSCMELDVASTFTSEPCPEGIIACAGNTLRIFTVDNVGSLFNQTSYRLRYTPRKLARLPGTSQLLIIETDQHEYNESEKKVLGFNNSAAVAVKLQPEGEEEEEEEATILPVRGPIPPVMGKWASCIRVFDAAVDGGKGASTVTFELSNNEAAFCMCVCKFPQHSEEHFVVVGVAKDMIQQPRSCSAAYLDVYRLLDNTLQLLHRTVIEDAPLCMCEFQGRLLVGCGRMLRMYDLGKKILLRKCENRSFPVALVRLQVHGDRIYVGDMVESVHFVKYKKAENVLSIFADDDTPRWVLLSVC